MAHPDHDAIIAAFKMLEPGIDTSCNRGGANGYTHIHGPGQPKNDHHCTNHLVCVEKQNGTVGLRAPLAQLLGAVPRPSTPISATNPLGYSVRGNYGDFDFGWDYQALLRSWPHPSSFALVVIAAAKARGIW